MDDELTYCAEDGHSTATTTCALGCSATDARCQSLDPASGLGPALEQAASKPDVTLPAGTIIDTSAGTVTDGGGGSIDVPSVLVPQGATMARVFIAKSFVIDGVVATGSYAVAFVAAGPITVRGMIDASANGTSAGPGAGEQPVACAGVDVPSVLCSPATFPTCNTGAGGGGNATPGALGGGPTPGGGAPGSALASPSLVGGCRGGTIATQGGGGGGGGVQLTSATSILLSTSGLIHVGGGDGANGAGGGAGGNIVLEAPRVRIDGADSGLAANGGAGGGCGMNGQDAKPTAISAAGPQCGSLSAGYGANGQNPPTSGSICTSNCPTFDYQYGGGGGALGRARILTRDGTFEKIGAPIISASLTMQPVATK